MSPPKYRQGDRVVVLPERGNPSVRPGVYTITRVMPASPDGLQHRARNEMDTHASACCKRRSCGQRAAPRR
jgi:hypothetical protein